MKKRARGTIGARTSRPGLWLRWKAADGTRRLRKAESDKPAEAEAELARILENEDAYLCEGPPTFAGFLADTFLPMYETEVSASSYERAVPQFKRMAERFGGMPVNAITPGDVRTYVADLRRSGLSAGTLRREVAVLRQENDILKKAAVILGTRLQPNSGK